MLHWRTFFSVQSDILEDRESCCFLLLFCKKLVGKSLDLPTSLTVQLFAPVQVQGDTIANISMRALHPASLTWVTTARVRWNQEISFDKPKKLACMHCSQGHHGHGTRCLLRGVLANRGSVHANTDDRNGSMSLNDNGRRKKKHQQGTFKIPINRKAITLQMNSIVESPLSSVEYLPGSVSGCIKYYQQVSLCRCSSYALEYMLTRVPETRLFSPHQEPRSGNLMQWQKLDSMEPENARRPVHTA